MDRILDRLYLGDFGDAETAEAPITAVVALCERRPLAHGQLVVHYGMADEVFHAPSEWSYRLQGLVSFLARGHTVLVHCRLGKSRSPALVAAYLAMIGHSVDLETAIAYVQAQRPLAEVHPETWRGVVAWWMQRLHSEIYVTITSVMTRGAH